MAAKSKKDPFVKLPWWFAAEAAKATKTAAALVWIELAYQSWKAKSLTFPLSNKRLERAGVSRDVKRRVLCDLERATLIMVERRRGRAPRVTLVAL
jgi:hypothetical protein